MLEVAWENFLGEKVLIDDNESNSITCPFDCISVLIILYKEGPYIQQFKGFLEEGRDCSCLTLDGYYLVRIFH